MPFASPFLTIGSKALVAGIVSESESSAFWEKPQSIPHPSLKWIALIDFGVDPVSNNLTLTITNQGVLENLVVSPALVGGVRFLTRLLASPLAIPAGTSADLSNYFFNPSQRWLLSATPLTL